MEIKIQIRGRVFSICFGHRTKWFAQMPWLTVTEEFFDEKHKLTWANFLWHSPVRIRKEK